MNSVDYSWSLRLELLDISHRWTWPLLAFLAGSLLGLLVGFILPSPYRSEADLFVAYNADAIYSNPDDYKNWQLEQLNDISVSQPILQETLTRLRAIDPYWQQIEVDELRPMLKTVWRNTGRWRMTAVHANPQYSQQAAQTWSQVYLDAYQQARQAAIQMLALDAELETLQPAQTTALESLGTLQLQRLLLEEWHGRQLDADPAQALPNEARLQLKDRVDSLSLQSPAWQSLVAEFPQPSAERRQYLSWVERALPVVLAEEAALDARVTALAAREQEVMTLYEQQSQQSKGLSSTVEVGRLYPTAYPAQPVRPTGWTTVIGGLLGLLTWCFLWLARPILRWKK